ncbi:MAG: HU family DNA-binding protein [Mycoplasmoidaceae bacterium]|nr:HU family DNA-binding protein [Mycoplasmoidaceae bacterium]
MAKVYTKKQLVAEVAKPTKLSQVKVVEVFAAASKVQKSKLKTGYIVRTENGQIKIVTRKARKGVNPQTGKRITIPAARKPKFVFSKEFKRGF